MTNEVVRNAVMESRHFDYSWLLLGWLVLVLVAWTIFELRKRRSY